MRLLPILAGCFAGCLAPATLATPAAAQTNYPWCSNFADGFGGTNCGFVSYEQCMATVRGSGGFCNKNDMYQPQGARPGSGPPSPHRSARRHHSKSS